MQIPQTPESIVVHLGAPEYRNHQEVNTQPISADQLQMGTQSTTNKKISPGLCLGSLGLIAIGTVGTVLGPGSAGSPSLYYFGMAASIIFGGFVLRDSLNGA